MVQLNMSLARHNELKDRYNGKSNGIHNELKGAGFDIDRDWSVGQDKKTGNYIFMQAEPKKKPAPVPKLTNNKSKGYKK